MLRSVSIKSLMMFTMMFLSVSCQEKETGRKVVVGKMTIQVISEPFIKSDAAQDYTFDWEEGDRFTAVYNTGPVIAYDDETFVNRTSYWSKELVSINTDGTLTLDVPEDCTQALLIYYGRQSAAKYQYVSGFGRSCIRTKLDSVLAYDSERHLTKNNTAIGDIDLDKKTVTLKGCMSLLMFNLPAESGVSNIQVSGNGVNITGFPFFDVRGTYHDKMLSDGADDKFTLTSVNPLVRGTYYIPVLPANYRNGITVTFVDSIGNTIVSETTGSMTLKRRSIYEMSLLDVPVSEFDGDNESYEDYMEYNISDNTTNNSNNI